MTHDRIHFIHNKNMTVSFSGEDSFFSDFHSMNSYTCFYLIFKYEYVLNYDNEIEVYSNKTDESILFI